MLRHGSGTVRSVKAYHYRGRSATTSMEPAERYYKPGNPVMCQYLGCLAVPLRAGSRPTATACEPNP